MGNRFKAEKGEVVATIAMIAAMDFVAHKLAMHYLPSVTLVQNQEADEICRLIGDIREKTLGYVFEEYGEVTAEELDTAAAEAIKTEMRKHKSYTAKRLYRMFCDYDNNGCYTSYKDIPPVVYAAKEKISYFAAMFED